MQKAATAVRENNFPEILPGGCSWVRAAFHLDRGSQGSSELETPGVLPHRRTGKSQRRLGRNEPHRNGHELQIEAQVRFASRVSVNFDRERVRAGPELGRAEWVQRQLVTGKSILSFANIAKRYRWSRWLYNGESYYPPNRCRRANGAPRFPLNSARIRGQSRLSASGRKKLVRDLPIAGTDPIARALPTEPRLIQECAPEGAGTAPVK